MEDKHFFVKTYYVVAHLGQNNLSSIKNYFATDYMLETVSFMYFLLFIYTFYLYKLDVSRNNFLLNSQNINTVSSELIDTQSAENCKGFSETVRQLPGIVKIYSFARLRNLRLRNAVKYPMCAFSSVTPAKQLDP